MTRLRIVFRSYLGRPYVVEEAQCVALIPKKGASPYATADGYFGPYVQVGTYATEDDARTYVKNRMADKIIAQFQYG